MNKAIVGLLVALGLAAPPGIDRPMLMTEARSVMRHRGHGQPHPKKGGKRGGRMKRCPLCGPRGGHARLERHGRG